MCGRSHEGPPFSYRAPAPVYWSDEYADDPRSVLEDDYCIIQAEHFFLRARLVIPVLDAEPDFEWVVWGSLSRPNFERALDLWTTSGRETEPPYFSWLSTELGLYPAPTLSLKTHLHTHPVGEVPCLELEPTDHPLAVEQRSGITLARVREIAALVEHGAPG
jgi:hypothetical protein